MKRLVILLTAALMLGGLTPVFSQEVDPLLQLLIDKKVLTQDEALTVQKEYDKKKETQKEEAKKAMDDATKPLKSVSDALKGLKIGGTYYLSYQNGSSFNASEADGLKSYNKFVLKRGYLDIRKEITPWLATRFTTDVHQDSDGNYLARQKYLYADFKWKGNKVFSNPHLEVGLIHTPWLDFEDSVNTWRMQDALFLDREKILASADSGIMFGTNFGPELPKSYQDEVSKGFPGKWGSMAVGIYNGGGYSKGEKNMNKMLQYRVSFRPVPAYLPGLQLTLSGANGKGNLEPANYDKDGIFLNERIYPDFNLINYMVSYQHARFTLAGQYFKAEGNPTGSGYYTPSQYIPGEVDYSDIFSGPRTKGYSYFGEVKLDDAKKWTLWARYEKFDPDTKGIFEAVKENSEDVRKRYIYGIAYKLYKDNIILLDYEKNSHTKEYGNILHGDTVIPDEDRVQLTLQIKF